MPRRCTICESDRLDEIDRMLVEGRTSFRRIASLCDVSEASVRRHAAKHLPEPWRRLWMQSGWRTATIFSIKCVTSSGELQDRHSVNILINPQWVEIRGAILQALEPHVKAREAVTKALGAVADGGS